MLLKECAEEERGHRGFMDGFQRSHTSDTISTHTAAMLFAVKRVAEYLINPNYPKGESYLHMQKSYFTAAGIAEEFREEIRTAWATQPITELAALDYTDFVKVKHEHSQAAA